MPAREFPLASEAIPQNQHPLMTGIAFDELNQIVNRRGRPLYHLHEIAFVIKQKTGYLLIAIVVSPGA